MAPKILKHGTAQASRVQPFCFSDNPAELEPDCVEQPLWPESSSPRAATTTSPKKHPPISAELQKPAGDLAQVEKTAYESAFRQGEKAGMEIAEKKVEAMMHRYAEAMFEVGKLKSSLYARVEREVVKLAVEVAKKIVHREIQADQEIIQTLVRVALSHVAEKSAVTVHINPIDYNYLLDHRAELSPGESPEIVLLADKSIERGGCLIQTECGDVDARIEEEFREVERSFFEGLR